MILAADVGGTKTDVGLFRRVGSRLRPVRESSYATDEAPSLEAILQQFLAEGKERIHRCAIGVAGPVSGERIALVNLKWPVDGRRLARVLRLPRVRLLNDLEAKAWGVGEIGPKQLASLTPGLRSRPGNAALIAAGTGLGTAILFWDGRRHHPVACEGGHQGFAPRDDLEIALLRYLRRKYGRASIERAVSGPALSAIYEFFVEGGWGERSRRMRRREAEEGDPNAAVAEAGMRGEDRLAEKALEMFVSIYGAAAGDLALVARATAGVYVGGGIAPRLLPKLREGAFMSSFRDKGRLSSMVEKIPVRVILEPRTALLGAAAAAEAPVRRARPATRRKK